MDLASFIRERLALEEYSFSRKEYIDQSGKKSESAASDLAYLSGKGEIMALRKGFYLIIPPRYSNLGVLPIELYVNKLFETIGCNYYLGLYTAAKFHGASHQQIHSEYIVSQGSRMLDIRKGKIAIDFFLTSHWPKDNIEQKKSDAGYFNVSDPVLTIADLIYHQSKLGGINRMLSNIDELLELVTGEALHDLLQWYPYNSVLQRMGFLMETLTAPKELPEYLYHHLSETRIFSVMLNTTDKDSPGAVGNRWKVDVNLELEAE